MAFLAEAIARVDDGSRVLSQLRQQQESCPSIGTFAFLCLFPSGAWFFYSSHAKLLGNALWRGRMAQTQTQLRFHQVIVGNSQIIDPPESTVFARPI